MGCSKLGGIRLDDIFDPTGNVNDRSVRGDRERYVGRHCLVKRNEDLAVDWVKPVAVTVIVYVPVGTLVN